MVDEALSWTRYVLYCTILYNIRDETQNLGLQRNMTTYSTTPHSAFEIHQGNTWGDKAVSPGIHVR